MPQEPYSITNLFDWTGGIRGRRKNPLAFPQDALTSGENVDLADGGLKSRAGTSVTSSGSLPNGTVRALKQVRFPTNEASYLLAQVEGEESDPGYFKPRADGPYLFEHSAIWDPEGQRMVIFGGGYGNPCVEVYNNVWFYYPTTDTWELAETTASDPDFGVPEARISHTAVYSSYDRAMIIYGGSDIAGTTYFDDVWYFNLTDLTWTNIGIDCTGDAPEARSDHTAIYRSSDNSMVVCGGRNDLDVLSAAEIYSLNLNGLEWSLISNGNQVYPDPRVHHTAAYDPTEDRMLVFAGVGSDWNTQYIDLWATEFDGLWTELPSCASLLEVDYEGTPYAPLYSSLVYYNNKLFSCFGQTQTVGENENGAQSYLIFDLESNRWSIPIIIADEMGATPKFQVAVVTDNGFVIVHGGTYQAYATGDTWWGVNVFNNGGSITNKLYASPDHLPTDVAKFTEIYDLGEGAGTVSIAVLNDRAVITEGINKPPLVWGGCMADDASDWMGPKAVLACVDGSNYYDISAEVCDKDTDTVADVQNIQVSGHIDICLDMPEVQALHVEMGTPNSGVPVEAQVYTTAVELDTVANITRHDLKAGIIRWYQDATTKGHFEGPEINIDSAAAVSLGSSKIGIPAAAHGLVSGQRVRIEGTTNYNGIFVLDALTTANQFVIPHVYIAESFTQGTEIARHCLTLGSGNNCPDVVAGMSVVFSDGEKTILTITDDGSAASKVELEQAHSTAEVTAVYGLVIDQDDNVLTVNSAAAGSMATSFSKTLNDAPFVSALGVSIRQIIKGANIASSGDYIQVTIQTSDGESIGTFYNDRVYLRGASIVERDETTGNGTTTPTQLAFPGSVFQLGGVYSKLMAPGDSLTSKLTKFTIDETKDYLVSMDFITYCTYIGAHVPTAETGKSPSVFLKQKQQGGGYYFKTGGGKSGYYGTPTCRLVRDLPFGFTDRSMFPVTVAVSKIEVHTNRSAPTALQVACTTDTIRAPLYFADDFVGVTVTEAKGNTGVIWHAFSLDNRSTWKVFKNGDFRNIVKLESVWKYLDDSDAWQNASANDMLTALREAFAIAENQMTGDELSAMTKDDWALNGGMVPKITQYMDLAVGMQVVGADVPSVTKYAVTFNDVGSVLIEGFKDEAWTPGDGWTDGTLVSGITLAKSGIISYEGGTLTLDYTVVNNVPGYWLRIKTNGTAPDTSITRILYKAPCQALANIGDGQPDTPNGFIYVDTSENSTQDYTEVISDNTETELSAAPIPMDTDDYLYVGFYDRFNAVEIAPFANNNKITSELSAEYWNGSEWVAQDITDGTAGPDGKTFSGLGRITFTLPSDWKQNIPFDAFLSRAYWVRFKVSAALTSTTAIAECRVLSVPPSLVKHRVVEVAGNRMFLGNRTDAPDQVDVSRELEEYGFIGADSGSYRVGGMDSIQAVAQAWNTLFVWKTESCHQLTGTDPTNFQFQMVEAARHIPINSRVIVKAPIGGGDGDRYGLFFINRFGAFVNTGLHTDALWNTSRGKSIADVLNWWDTNNCPRLDPDYLHLACGEYWPVKNWIVWAVPIIVSDSPQTTNNRLIVYDLNLQAWLPPFTIGIASLTTAYHYSLHAPNRLGEIGLYGGDYSGRILRLFHPHEASDAGVPVDCWVETGWLHFGSPEFKKILRLVSVHGKTSNSPVTVTVQTDGDESSSVSLVFDDLSNLNAKLFGLEQESNNIQGRFFKFRISFSGSGDIYGMQIGVSLIREWGIL